MLDWRPLSLLIENLILSGFRLPEKLGSWPIILSLAGIARIIHHREHRENNKEKDFMVKNAP